MLPEPQGLAARALTDEEIARLLSVKPGAPLLYIERVTFSQDNIPMEYLRVYYRADRYALHNELVGGAG